MEEAKKHPAVIGSRMMGGGFGGCTINIVTDEGLGDFIEEASQNYKAKFIIDPEAYVVEIGDGTGEYALTP